MGEKGVEALWPVEQPKILQNLLCIFISVSQLAHMPA